MLRSYSYAAWSGLFEWSRATGADGTPRTVGLLWESAVGSTFLSAYLAGTRDESFIPSDDETFDGLLGLLMLDKGMYELDYELNNRPDVAAGADRGPAATHVAVARIERRDAGATHGGPDFATRSQAWWANYGAPCSN